MPSKTEWVSVIVTEADGSQHPGKIVPVAKYDMNRPGILSNREFFYEVVENRPITSPSAERITLGRSACARLSSATSGVV